VATNASQLLCAVIAASTEAPACLEDGEEGRTKCAQLVKQCIGKEMGDAPNLSALEVVIDLLGRQRESQAPSLIADSLFGAIEADIERFFAAVAAPSPLPARFASFFSSDERPAYRPRGQQRCKLLLLMEECLKSERPSLLTPLLDLGLFPIVIDLLVMPHTCNALHMRTAAILEWAAYITIPSAPSLASAIRKALITDAQVAQRLIALVDECTPPPLPAPTPAGKAADGSEPAPVPRSKPLPCCHSFVMHIGACLLAASQREPEVRELLQQCDPWGKFIAPGGALTTWEQRTTKPLGGLAPTRGSDDNDSDDDDELDVSTMERVLAAQVAASQRATDLNSTADNDDVVQDDDEDDEGGHSSEYLQHFAHYLSNRNFLNQTSDNGDLGSIGEQLPPPNTEAWTAEFALEDFEGDASGGAAPGPADSGGGAATGMVQSLGAGSDFDLGVGGSGTGGATTAEAAAGSSSLGTPYSNSWFAGRAASEFESLSSSSASADGDDVHGWAAFDTAPPTGPAPAPAATEQQPSADSASPASDASAAADSSAAMDSAGVAPDGQTTVGAAPPNRRSSSGSDDGGLAI